MRSFKYPEFRQISKNPSVLFVGYKIPHPLEHYFLLKIQTTADTTPKDVLTMEIERLVKTIEDISQKFRVFRIIM